MEHLEPQHVGQRMDPTLTPYPRPRSSSGPSPSHRRAGDTSISYNTWPGAPAVPAGVAWAVPVLPHKLRRDGAAGHVHTAGTVQALVVCAGSPRASSTAECTIAQHVLEYMLTGEKQKGYTDQDKATYLGYWNYHLHTLCGDGDGCRAECPADHEGTCAPGWTGSANKLDQTYDEDAKTRLSGILQRDGPLLREARRHLALEHHHDQVARVPAAR